MTLNNKKIFAVTGGIGCGKSLVSQMLREEGYPVFSSDDIYAELTSCGGRLVAVLEKEFTGITAADGSLDRRAMSGMVFRDENARMRLNRLTHPVIMDELLWRARGAENDMVFCEVPLLFENGYQALFDGVIVVMRSLQARISAVAARSGLCEEEILSRIKSQCDYSKLDLGSCYVIENNGGMNELREKVKKILQNITKLT